jgi:DNA-directed RNA polymerase subunit M/transcription elongation factor TFIIS
MGTEIKFVCSNCGQHITAPQEASGETVSCPTCGTEITVSTESATTLPEQKSHKSATVWILSAVISLLVVSILFAGFISNTSHAPAKPEVTVTGPQPATNSIELWNSPIVAKETIPQPVPIEDLFGVKLGEPLLPSCKITDTGEATDGFYWIEFIPPEANSVFDRYYVYLDATRRVVAAIYGDQRKLYDSSEFERTRDAIIAKFRERYGKEEFRSGGEEGYFSTYTWKRGKRDITLTRYFVHTESSVLLSFAISCTDKDFYDSVEKSKPPKPPVDTRGL